MKLLFIILLFGVSLVASTKSMNKLSVRLQWFDQFQFAGYYIAKHKGIYDKYSLDVEIKKFNPKINMYDDVVSSKTSFGIGRSDLIRNQQTSQEIILISSVFQSSPHILISTDPKITKVKDFALKKIMTIGDDVQTASIHAMLHSGGLEGDDIKCLKDNFTLNDLIDGKIDLYSGYISNEPYTLKQQNIPFRTYSPKDYGFDFYSDILYTSRSLAKENPDIVELFKKATLEGWSYAFNNIEESVDIIYNNFNDNNKSKEALLFEAKELKKLAYYKTTELGKIDKHKLQRIYDIYKLMGLAEGKFCRDEAIFSSKPLFNEEELSYLRNKKHINICVLPDALPYSAVSSGKYIGIGAEILRLTKQNISVNYKLVKTKTWVESIRRGVNGACDLFPLASKTPSRQNYFNFTSAFHEEPLVMVTDRSKPYIINVADYMNKRFSIVSGQSFIENVRLKYPNILLTQVSNTAEGFKGVEDGKFYAHIDVLMGSAYWLKQLNKNTLRISGRFNDKINVGFAVRKDDAILFSIYEKLAKDLKRKELRKLLNNWVEINYTQKIEFKYMFELVGFVIVFIIFFLYRQNLLKKNNNNLKELQDELLELNKALETTIADKVDEIVKKDTYMLHQSRLAQMGEMLSMIAHQWKQPLGSISTLQISINMAIELNQYDLDDLDQREKFLFFIQDKLIKIDANTKNLSQIISNFSDFYKPNKQSKIMLLDNIVLKSCNLIEDILRVSSIELRLDLNSHKLVKLYENEFMQVVLTIIANAKEQLQNNSIKDAYIYIKSYDKDDFLYLEIIDNALGIDDALLSKIFEPYFSTKLEKNGTGLGLYMARNIVQEHHQGQVYAQNINNGASFIIKLKAEECDEE